MNKTPSSERIHIGFFGCRNAGKSSLVNAVTGQEMALVSEHKGTTTDPVQKAMELLPLGPVVIIDTPGFDDEGSLGQLRVKKTRQVLNRIDVAVLVVDGTKGLAEADRELLGLFREKNVSCLIALNKSDLQDVSTESERIHAYIEEMVKSSDGEKAVELMPVSALEGSGIWELKEAIGRLGKGHEKEKKLVADLLRPGDIVLLVIPIDKAAPKGRLILPQQMMLRDILDANAIGICIKENEIIRTLDRLKVKPALVITDSQAFERVAKDVPEDIPLTSFSILMARYKGILRKTVEGVRALQDLCDGDTILISEGCTHHRQCDDIGTYKLPKWLKEYTGKDFKVETSSGMGFPEDLTPYRFVLHCGACMLNDREVLARMKSAEDQSVPMTNYGITIAAMKGILERSIRMLPEIQYDMMRES